MRKVILFFVVLLAGCSRDIESNEEADREISRVTAQYREAVFAENKVKAHELEDRVFDLIRTWRESGSTCTVRAFQQSAQNYMVYAIPMEYLMNRKAKLTEPATSSALTQYYSVFHDAEVAPEKLERAIEFCRDTLNVKYTPADLAAIHAVFRPLQQIDRDAKEYFPLDVWNQLGTAYANDVAKGEALQHARAAANSELSDCVAAATADPKATAPVSRDEIVAACKTMLR
ncbi:hypothetical protein GCM10025794_01150 [Massilia kyonggiensis]|nr:hypothetical protein [Massilia kyonggiensis]